MRKINKKYDEDLLEISTNFNAERGVTYKNNKGIITSKGEQFKSIFQTGVTTSPQMIRTQSFSSKVNNQVGIKKELSLMD
jgi:hypothetical protein